MDDSFDKFLQGVEAKTRSEDFERLLENRIINNDGLEKTKAEVAALEEEIASRDPGTPLDPETAAALLKRAENCSQAVLQNEKTAAHRISILEKQVLTNASNKTSTEKLLADTQDIETPDLDATELEHSIDDIVAQARQRQAEQRRQTQEAAGLIKMADIATELTKIKEMRRTNRDLTTERDAQWSLIEDMDKDLHDLQGQVEKADSEMAKMLEEITKGKESLRDDSPRLEALIDELAATTEEEKRLDEVLDRHNARNKDRTARLEKAEGSIYTLVAAKDDLLRKIEAEKARHALVVEKRTEKFDLQERGICKSTERKAVELTALEQNKKTVEEEYNAKQKELKQVLALRQAYTEEAAEIAVHDSSLAKMAEQKKSIQDTIQKKKNEEATAKRTNEEVITRRRKELEAQKEQLATSRDVLTKEQKNRDHLRTKTDTLRSAHRKATNQVETLEAQAKLAEEEFNRARAAAAAQAKAVEEKNQRALKAHAPTPIKRPSSKHSARNLEQSMMPRGSGDHLEKQRTGARKEGSGVEDALFARTSRMSQRSVPSVEKKQPPPTRKAAAKPKCRLDDSLFGSSGEDDDVFDLSFSSIVKPQPQPKKKASAPPKTHSPIHFDASDCVTSTPIKRSSSPAKKSRGGQRHSAAPTSRPTGRNSHKK